MCYGGKCLHCIPLEIGSLIFGYLQAGVFCVMALVFVGLSASCGPISIKDDHSQSYYFSNYYSTTSYDCFIYSVQIIPVSLAFFIFAVLLVFGVHYKRSSFIMAYFSFGVVALVTTFIYFIVMAVRGNLTYIAALFSDVLFSHLLVMVFQTAKKIEMETMKSDVEEPLARPGDRQSAAPPSAPPSYAHINKTIENV